MWNRIRKLRESGVVGAQTVQLDAEALGFEACFFVLIRTSEHEADWQRAFLKALQDRPEVQEAHRLAGDIDYILKVRVKNARAYDEFYQALIAEVRVYIVTALLSMDVIKSSSALPLLFVRFGVTLSGSSCARVPRRGCMLLKKRRLRRSIGCDHQRVQAVKMVGVRVTRSTC